MINRTVLAGVCATMLVATAGKVQAGVIPFGLQSSVSQATLDSWGWNEIHRSNANTSIAPGQGVSSIVAAATGDHLMMGFWDRNNQVYAILGAGETSVVTTATYANYSDDNNSSPLNNWSNGLNFYRTSGSGSWGFTTSNYVDLNSADLMLLNGIQSNWGKVESPVSRGMSIHLNANGGGDLSPGWAFNVTGNNFTGASSQYERVFFTTDAQTVPEPASIAIFGLGTLGLAGIRRRKLKRA